MNHTEIRRKQLEYLLYGWVTHVLSSMNTCINITLRRSKMLTILWHSIYVSKILLNIFANIIALPITRYNTQKNNHFSIWYCFLIILVSIVDKYYKRSIQYFTNGNKINFQPWLGWNCLKLIMNLCATRTTKNGRRQRKRIEERGMARNSKWIVPGKIKFMKQEKNLHKDSSRPINEVPEIPEIW